MLVKIQEKDYRMIKERHHRYISQYPLINAVISAAQEGFVYADPSTGRFFISTKSGFSLYGCFNQASKFEAALFEFLKQTPEIPAYLHIYHAGKSFQEHVRANWDKCWSRRRAQFRYLTVQKTHNYEKLLPHGYRLVALREIRPHQLEGIFQLDFAHRYWNSLEDFLTHAIGFCILDEKDAPSAICYSACIVDGYVEMDMLVLPEQRGRGFLKIVCEPFLNLAIERNLIPHWDTFVSNTASYRTAQRLGLQLIQKYDLLSLLVRT